MINNSPHSDESTEESIKKLISQLSDSEKEKSLELFLKLSSYISFILYNAPEERTASMDNFCEELYKIWKEPCEFLKKSPILYPEFAKLCAKIHLERSPMTSDPIM